MAVSGSLWKSSAAYLSIGSLGPSMPVYGSLRGIYGCLRQPTGSVRQSRKVYGESTVV